MANESRLVVIEGLKPQEIGEQAEMDRLIADFRAALARQKAPVKLPPPPEEDE